MQDQDPPLDTMPAQGAAADAAGAPEVRGGGADVLVYTSAGRHSNVRAWVDGERNFDLWITCYEPGDDRLRELADIYHERRGGKFPNLHHCYMHWPELLHRYRAIFVLDDDLQLSCRQVNACFRYRDRYGLWLLQPAFDRRGKVSHRVTRRQRLSRLRLTSFVEVTCPLFRADKLFSFLDIYDPALVGYGVDYWFLDHLGNGPDHDRVAVIDAVPALNPHDDAKPEGREIERLQPGAERIAHWERIRDLRGIEYGERDIVTYRTLRWLPWRV